MLIQGLPDLSPGTWLPRWWRNVLPHSIWCGYIKCLENKRTLGPFPWWPSKLCLNIPRYSVPVKSENLCWTYTGSNRYHKWKSESTKIRKKTRLWSTPVPYQCADSAGGGRRAHVHGVQATHGQTQDTQKASRLWPESTRPLCLAQMLTLCLPYALCRLWTRLRMLCEYNKENGESRKHTNIGGL